MTTTTSPHSEIKILDVEDIPERIAKKRRKYPFDKLTRPGMSFMISHEDMPNVSSIRSAASFYALKHGVTFTVEDGAEEVRVWRLA